MHMAEGLKDATRHCYTSKGRHESVAEHSWRMCLMAFLLKEDFPEANMEKVIQMCIIHDLGEVFTGDIPTFAKTPADEQREENLLDEWVGSISEPAGGRFKALYDEMEKMTSLEAKIYKALDGLEALIQHNESDIKTWADNEYSLNLTHGDDRVAFSPYLKALREAVREETKEKIARGEKG